MLLLATWVAVTPLHLKTMALLFYPLVWICLDPLALFSREKYVNVGSLSGFFGKKTGPNMNRAKALAGQDFTVLVL